MRLIPDFFGKAESKNRGPNSTEATFLALMSSIPGQSWYSLKYLEDGEPDCFLAGINLPTGTVTLTFPASLTTLVEKTGASALPLPFSSGTTSEEEFIDGMVRFASR
jgi:hypothetical protein